MQAHVVASAATEDVERSCLMGGIMGSHPQKKSTMLNVLVEMPGMLPPDKSSEHSANSSAGSGCQRCNGDRDE